VITYESLKPLFLNRDGVRLAHFEAAPKALQKPAAGSRQWLDW